MNCPHPALHRQRAEYSEDRIEKSRETRLQQYAEARLLDQDCTLDRIGRKKFGRHTYYFGAEFAHQKGQIRETTDEVIFSQHGTILKKVPKKGQFPL